MQPQQEKRLTSATCCNGVLEMKRASMVERIAFRAYPAQRMKLKRFCESKNTKPGPLFRGFIENLEMVDSGQTLTRDLPRRYQNETRKPSSR
jgi:hypothetical protein